MKWLSLCLAFVLANDALAWGRLFYTQAEREQRDQDIQFASQPVSRRFDGELHTPRGSVRWVDGKMDQPPAGIKPGERWQE